jgi:hypothetical protein
MRASWRWQNAWTIARLCPVYFLVLAQERLRPLGKLAAWAHRTPTAKRERDRSEEARLIACIVRLCRWFGAIDRNCLRRSVLLYRELSRVGAGPTLNIGFRQGSGGLEGHAWVVLDGRAVAEADPAGVGYEVGYAFGSQQRNHTNRLS